MSAVIAGGVCCAGADLGHPTRTWTMDADRRFSILEPSRKHPLPGELLSALRLPVPGKAEVLTFSPWRLTAVLSSGAVWRLSWREVQMWRTESKECDMPENLEKSAFIAAGTGCGHTWVVDAARRIFTLGHGGRVATTAPAIPGSARPLAVDIASRTVVLESGERYCWAGGPWKRLGALSESDGASPGMVKVRMLSGVRLAVGDRYPGDILELPESEARTLLARGILELCEEVQAS